MSREPSSPMHGGGWRSYDKPPEPTPEPTRPKPGKGKNIKFRPTPREEAVLTKLTTTTEALTTNELALLHELRRTDAENGRTNGATAGGALSKIERAKGTP